MIDHIFVKLLHISLPSLITNSYLHQQYEASKQDIVNFVLKHAQTNYEHAESDILLMKQQLK